MGNNILDRIIADRPNPTPEQIERCRLRAEQLAKESVSKPITKCKHRQPITIEQKQRKLAAKMGMDYDTWLLQARKYYTIDLTTFTVTSIAMSPDKPRTWLCDCHDSAELKIIELIEYKYNDHFHKGYTFKWE